jgi:membrane-bound serine protease (ClpP class)
MRPLPLVRSLGAIAALGLSANVSAAEIHKVVVEGIITGVTAQHIVQSIQEADQEEAELLLLQLATPGGLYDATREIIEAILASPKPVVVYVAPAGAHAASAGFLITLSADVAAMAPGTNMGASTPVAGTGQELPETMQRKVQSDAAAYTRSIAERRGRDPALAEKAVTEATAWTASEALELGLIDYVVTTEAELIRVLDGRPVKRVDGSEVVLRTEGLSVRLKEMSLKQRILSVIANPNLAVVLGLIGLAGLYMEFSNPGAIVPGVVGAISLLLAAFAFQILPVTAVGVLLLLVGFGLLVAEAFTPSFGALGAGGVVSIVFGALFLIEEQPLPSPALRVSWPMILPVAILFGVLVVLLGRMILKSQRQLPVTGADGLVGQIATARTSFGKSDLGKVFVHGEFWDAQSSESVQEGEQVRVKGVDGLKLEVERL